MNPSRSIEKVESELAALRAAAERAGTALACLFSSSDEFEAEVVRVRREQGAYRSQIRQRRSVFWGIVIGLLVIAFVLL